MNALAALAPGGGMIAASCAALGLVTRQSASPQATDTGGAAPREIRTRAGRQ
jgi:hypothetical protein